jgi:hypothetical protein
VSGGHEVKIARTVSSRGADSADNLFHPMFPSPNSLPHKLRSSLGEVNTAFERYAD